MALLYAAEKRVALAAVRRACAVTNLVFNKLANEEKRSKEDRSPVTVGDYAAQALISTILQRAFPRDLIVGEEDSKELRCGSEAYLRKRIVDLANIGLTSKLVFDEEGTWGIGPGQERSEEEILNAIDRGNHEGGNTGRMWTIDPIDGTKGFLRGGQYSVCISLIVDAKVKIGIIGCPNLWVVPGCIESERGCIFVAVDGQGTEQISLSGLLSSPLCIPFISPDNINFLESVESDHSSHAFSSRLAETLKVKIDPIRMDSQVKYACLARGEGAAYLRIPTSSSYQEKIWDHAPGFLLVQEAGGTVTDMHGEPLDFGLGRTLGEKTEGVVAAGKAIHFVVINAIQKITAENTPTNL